MSLFMLFCHQQFCILLLYLKMGNQQGKPALKQQPGSNSQIPSNPGDSSLSQIPSTQQKIGDNKKIDTSQNNNSPKKNNQNMINKKIQSRGPSALDNYRQQTNISSVRGSPQLVGKGLQSMNPNQDYQRANQNSSKQNYISNLQDDNEFMPLMKLDATGEIRLRITLVQLVLQKQPKPHLKKNSSVYNSTMTWKKDARNVFTFVLKEDQNYQLMMEVDLQGNTLNGKDQFWSALCPINIPIGQTVKVGQMTCVNWYCKLQFDEDEDEDEGDSLGPSIKNIDFKISEDTFGKWGEKVPKSFYDETNNQAIKKVYKPPSPQKFVAYKQLSRYFDSKNIWRASTYFQQTTQHFRGWVIQVTDHNSVATISKQLHADLKNRESFYAQTMFSRQFGQE